jgi:hypothetical protein
VNDNTIQINIFRGIGLGYTNNTVVTNFMSGGRITRQTKRRYHSFIFLFLKFHWVTGDPHNVDVNIDTVVRPTPVHDPRPTIQPHRMLP